MYSYVHKELLGLAIGQLWNSKKFKKHFNLKDTSMFAIQALDRLQFIHYKNIIHRDIKPNNFVIGRIDPKIIYLIDLEFLVNIEVLEQENI